MCVCAHQVKLDFLVLLEEQHVEGGQRWRQVKERLEGDPRYKAVDSSNLREKLYKHYLDKQAKVGLRACVLVCVWDLDFCGCMLEDH